MNEPNSPASGSALPSDLSDRIPEQGQLVSVRGRQWIVSDVRPFRPEGDAYRQSDLVTLESIDEDSDGKPVSVVWQIEPGARILEKAGLPAVDGFDPNDRLDAFLDAIRWGISTNVDRKNLLAPFRSGITVEDYQLDPLVRAVDMARVNLLVADDTGLGKTVEAGLVVQEMLLRHRARTVLVVAPASNLTNWQREMREKFGLDFQIVDTEFLRQFRRTRGIRANPWTSFPFLIASMDWIKQGEGFRLLKDALPPQITHPRKFDVLIVDEAHNIAPTGRGNCHYAGESLRTKAIRRIAPHFAHHLFLSATPHNGYRESFTGLLEILDDQRFARTVEPSAVQLQQVMVRRLKRDIVDKDGHPVFPKRELLPLEVDYTDEERDIHATLQRFMASRFAAAERAGRRNATGFVMTMLKKRLFSSPRAFATTLQKYRDSLARAGTLPSDSRAKARLDAAIARATEDSADEEETEEAVSEAVQASASLAVPLSAEERSMLDKLSAWAGRNANISDSKAKAILDWLRAHLKTPDGKWNDERVILFTEFRATHDWLKQILALNGFAGGDALMELHGSLSRDERDAVINAFQTAPGPDSPVRILLATDAASEGINLHEHCRYLIHVEIPWNPNVMEQRNGRIDRHGQKSPTVSIWHPVGRGFDPNRAGALRPGDIAGDGEYLLRTAIKVDAIREDLGSVGAVLDAQIEAAMLARPLQLCDPDVANVRRERARKALAMERNLKARIAELHDNLLASRAEANLSPENVRRAVETALAMDGKPSLEPASVPDLPPGSAWTVPVYDDVWRDASVGLAHPHTGRIRPVVFDSSLAAGRDDVVLAHLNHPLVRLSLRLLREIIWSPKKTLHRVAVRSVPGLQNPMAFVWSRLLVVGGDHRRLHEELLYSGGELKEESYRREEVLEKLRSLLAASHPFDDVPDTVFAVLKRRFDKFEPSIVRAYETRSGEVLNGILRKLAQRRDSEIRDIGKVLDDLAAAIRRELKIEEDKPAFEQLTFDFGEREKEEFRRDLDSLRSRLARIPDEKRDEAAAVERHYASPRALSFPAAVLFLVPETPVWGCRR